MRATAEIIGYCFLVGCGLVLFVGAFVWIAEVYSMVGRLEDLIKAWNAYMTDEKHRVKTKDEEPTEEKK